MRFIGKEEFQYLMYSINESIEKNNDSNYKMKNYSILFPENHYINEASSSSVLTTSKPTPPKTSFGPIGSGSGAPTKEKKDSIMFGDMSNMDKAAAAGMYAAGGIGDLLGPHVVSGAESFADRLTKNFGGSIGKAFAGNVLGQLKQLSGYDFVNINLGNIANANMQNVLGGMGKPFAPILIPKSKSVPSLEDLENQNNSKKAKPKTPKSPPTPSPSSSPPMGSTP
jgi:hypothetical protein